MHANQPQTHIKPLSSPSPSRLTLPRPRQRFNGQHGQAYLFETVFNIAEGEAEDRQMTTGLHRVRDIRCAKCGQTMGWKYVSGLGVGRTLSTTYDDAGLLRDPVVPLLRIVIPFFG